MNEGEEVRHEINTNRAALRKPRRWKQVFVRVKARLVSDNISIIAAGVAFYILLAIVPAMAALVAVYGIFSDPLTIGTQLDMVGAVLPGEARQMIEQQLQRLAMSSSGALSVGAAVGVLISLWSAMKGTKAIMTALNVAYDEPEKRGFFKLNLIALCLTTGAMLFFILALALIAVMPVVFNWIGLGAVIEWIAAIVRWPLVFAFLLLALASLYRWAPARMQARWIWMSHGALLAGALWLIGSAGFSVYVSLFGNYNATYGSLGAVVVVLMWLYISAYVILLGAEVNAEIERQAAMIDHQSEADSRTALQE